MSLYFSTLCHFFSNFFYMSRDERGKSVNRLLKTSHVHKFNGKRRQWVDKMGKNRRRRRGTEYMAATLPCHFYIVLLENSPRSIHGLEMVYIQPADFVIYYFAFIIYSRLCFIKSSTPPYHRLSFYYHSDYEFLIAFSITSDN